MGDEQLIDNSWKIKYELALKLLEDNIKIIMYELNKSNIDVPIEQIKGRIKDINSIKNKLNRHGYELNVENISEILSDVAAIRIVSYFKQDVYKIVELIKKIPGITVLNSKDYIENPKDTGYSSYHMIVRVPVYSYINDKYDSVRAEIQIRTLAMDLWASLEHKIRYKKDFDLAEEMKENIKEASNITYELDEEMDNIIKLLRNNTRTIDSQESLLFKIDNNNKISNININKYELAMDWLNGKIELINKSFGMDLEENPIEDIKFRIKPLKSIWKKLHSMRLEISEYNMDYYFNDIVGIRIVCSFLTEMDMVIEKIQTDDDIKIIDIEDMVTKPKDNGYSSYHMIIGIPIYINGKQEYVKAEIQVRTKAMHMWSCLQRRLCYKKESTKEIEETLKNYALKLREIDNNFDKIIQSVRSYNEYYPYNPSVSHILKRKK